MPLKHSVTVISKLSKGLKDGVPFNKIVKSRKVGNDNNFSNNNDYLLAALAKL